MQFAVYMFYNSHNVTVQHPYISESTEQIRDLNFIRRGSMEPKYTVRQATEMTGVMSYVLRYWE